MTATETTPSLSFDELTNMKVGDYLKFAMLAPLSGQKSEPFIWQIQTFTGEMNFKVKLYIVDQVDAKGMQTEEIYLTRDTVGLLLEIDCPITIPTMAEIEAAKRQREANLIKALEARIDADTQALATSRERLRLLDPNTTT